MLMMLRSKKKTSKEVSLYEPIGQDKEGNEIHLLDIIEQQQPDIVDCMDCAEKLKKLLVLIDSCLDDREKEIIHLRYGLNGNRELTQNDVGARLGISRSYVSRIEKRALLKLRAHF